VLSKVNIKIKFFAFAACEIGLKELDLLVNNELFKSVTEIEEAIKWPLRSNLENNRFSLMLNGRVVKLPIENGQLTEGDVLALVPIMGGG